MQQRLVWNKQAGKNIQTHARISISKKGLKFYVPKKFVISQFIFWNNTNSKKTEIIIDYY